MRYNCDKKSSSTVISHISATLLFTIPYIHCLIRAAYTNEVLLHQPINKDKHDHYLKPPRTSPHIQIPINSFCPFLHPENTESPYWVLRALSRILELDFQFYPFFPTFCPSIRDFSTAVPNGACAGEAPQLPRYHIPSNFGCDIGFARSQRP